MRWPAVLVIGYVLLGLELGLREFLRLGPTTSAPSFVIPLMVFVALFAQPLPTMWTALVLGLAIDLTTTRGELGAVVAGPHALGMMAGAYFVLTVRSLVVRRNPLTLMVLSGLAAALCHVVVLGFFAVRMLYTDSLGMVLSSELGNRALSSLFTLGTGLVLAGVLFPLSSVLGAQEQHSRRVFGRR